MKKRTFILLISLAFVSTDIIAQWTNSGSGRISRTGGADRGSDSSGIYATQGDWSTDAMISQYTSSQTLNDQAWEGTSHSGMGASGWGSTAMGAYKPIKDVLYSKVSLYVTWLLFRVLCLQQELLFTAKYFLHSRGVSLQQVHPLLLFSFSTSKQ